MLFRRYYLVNFHFHHQNGGKNVIFFKPPVLKKSHQLDNSNNKLELLKYLLDYLYQISDYNIQNHENEL